jgi:hypothetical protein
LSAAPCSLSGELIYTLYCGGASLLYKKSYKISRKTRNSITGNGTSITTSYSNGTINGDYNVGGLVGDNISNIAASSCTAATSGIDNVGGLVGVNKGNITSSYSTGSVTGIGKNIGGLVGSNDQAGFVNNGIITTSFSTGAVSGDENVGGLVGENNYNIITSYSVGKVIGNKHVGGLVGYNDDGIIIMSLWDVDTSKQLVSSGGTGLTTFEMQDISTFLEAGWDFVDEYFNGTCDYWQISSGDYPQLRSHSNGRPVIQEGLGTAQEPYLIRGVRDLGEVWLRPKAHYRLETSLDLSEITWSMAVVPWFGGTFDGNGYLISNLHIQGGSCLGLFGQLDTGAIISNLGLEAIDVNGTSDHIGGLAGENYYGSIISSHSTGTVSGNESIGGFLGYSWKGNINTSFSNAIVMGTGDNVGGLTGDNVFSNITMSYSTGKISGDTCVGGLVGYNHGGNIISSYNAGTITGIRYHIGGLVGFNNNGSITSSCNIGTITGTSAPVGGLVGYNWASSITTSYSTGTVIGPSDQVGGLLGYNWNSNITMCYSTGVVTGPGKKAGGLIGNNWYSSITASFWDIEASNQLSSSGGTGLTTTEMQTASTFLNAGWDFVDETENGTEDIWWILEGQDYPRLWWELIE